MKRFVALFLGMMLMINLIIGNGININAVEYVLQDTVIDNNAVTTGDGTFGTSSSFATKVGADHLYANAYGAWAKWPITNIENGRYKVYVNKLIHTGNTSKAEVIVHHNGQSSEVQIIDLSSGVAEYHLLGEYVLTGDGTDFVQMTNKINGKNIRVDAVKLVPMEIFDNGGGNGNANDTVTPVITTAEITEVAANGAITVNTNISSVNADAIKDKTVTFQVKENGELIDTIYIDHRVTTGTEGIRVEGEQNYYDVPLTFYSSRMGLADETIEYVVTVTVDGESVEKTYMVTNRLNPDLPTVITVDNGDAGFTSASEVVFGSSTTGDPTFPTREGNDHLYSKSADGYGRWAPTLEPGSYRVLINRLIHSGNTTNATATIYVNGDSHRQSVNLASGEHGYYNLGTYSFAGTGDEYLELKNDNSVRQLRLDAVKFVIDKAAAPKASNLDISAKNGTIRVKDTLVLGYSYSDDNGDSEAGTEYSLFRTSDLKSNEWTLIDSGIVSAIEDFEYVLTSADEGQYIKLEVTPKNNGETYTAGNSMSKILGTKVLPGLPEAVPVASNLMIEGDPVLLGRIQGSYDYSDVNNDVENGTVFEWLVADNANADANWTVAKSGTTLDNKVMQYITSNDDYGKYIKVRVKPKNSAPDLNVGQPVESNVIGPIESVYIIDNSNLENYYESEYFGSSSYGGKSYNNTHRWNEIEGVHCKWYMTGALVGQYKVSFYYPAYHTNNVLKPGIEIGSGDNVQYSGLLDFTGFTSDNDGTWIELGTYNFRPDEEAYIKLINTTGKVIRSDAVKFERIGDYDVLPYVSNLQFGGSFAPGQILEGSYDYNDINGDVEDGTVYTWYRGDSADTNLWTAITSDTISASDKINYTLSPEDSGKYIKLAVEPKNVSGTGEVSALIKGPVADSDKAPIATGLSLEGKPWVDYTLNGTYDYVDENFDVESGSVYTWYYSDDYEDEDEDDDEKDDEQNWIVIDSGDASSADLISKVITADYQDMYIRLGITPKNNFTNDVGEEVFSNVIGPFEVESVKPVLTDVHMSGQMVNAQDIKGAALGGEIKAEYTFTHELNYSEGTDVSSYQWYIGNSISGSFAPIDGATSEKYTPDELAAGRYIRFSVVSATIDGQVSEITYSEALPVNWKLTFVDEFDYVAEDGYSTNLTDKWIVDSAHRVLGNPVTHSARIPENVEVSDGLFKIHTRKEHLDKYSFEHTWTTGNVMTKETIMKYGYYEASYKLAKATGLNQSFWSMTQNGLYENPKFLEMDFNEGHYPHELSTNLHWHGKDTSGKALRLTNHHIYYPIGTGEATFGNQFVKVGGMLKPNDPAFAWDAQENSDTYRIFVNDQLIRSTQSVPYDPDMSKIYLSVAVLPGFAGYLDEEAADGSIMEVDYVRYFTPIEMKVDDSQSGNNGNNSSGNSSGGSSDNDDESDDSDDDDSDDDKDADISREQVAVEVEDGKISEDDFEKALNAVKASKDQDKKEKQVRFIVPMEDGATEAEAELAVNLFESSKEAKVDRIAIDTGLVTIAITPDAFGDELEDDSKVTLSVERLDEEATKDKIHEKIAEKLKKVKDVDKTVEKIMAKIADKPIYDFNAFVDDEQISKFEGEKPVKITVPYELGDEEKPNKIVVYYIDDDGNLEVMRNCKYDAASSKVSFTTKHFSYYIAVEAVSSFLDLDDAMWAIEYIETLEVRGITVGMERDIFAPNENITREQFVSMLAEAVDIVEEDATSAFKDIDSNIWYSDAVAAAKDYGITKGINEDEFGVGQEITREQMATMAYRAMITMGIELPEANQSVSFKDNFMISAYALESVDAMQKADIINGMGNGMFNPQSQATRAQAAKIIYKIYHLID